jgi:hypothetical protein
MTDREIALDIGKKWLNADAKVTASEALLNERVPGWKELLSPILARMPLSSQQTQLQNAIDEDKSDDSVIRILHQVLFEKVLSES